MMTWAVRVHKGPVAVRYPRGGNGAYEASDWDPNKTVVAHRSGKDCALITYGTLVNNALEAAELLAQKGIEASVIRLTRLEIMDWDGLQKALSGCRYAIVLEEVCSGSGIYESIAARFREISVSGMDLGKRFTPHGSVSTLYHEFGLDAQSVAAYAQEVVCHEN